MGIGTVRDQYDMKTPQAVVAIILALTVMLTLVGSSEVAHWLAGVPVDGAYDVEAEVVTVWENLLFAIIGALSGYIVMKEK